MRGFFANIISGVKKENEEGSPSKVYARRGAMMAAGVGVGFMDQFRDVSSKIQNQFLGLNANLSTSMAGGGNFSMAGASAGAGAAPISVTVEATVAKEIDIYILAREVAEEIARRQR